MTEMTKPSVAALQRPSIARLVSAERAMTQAPFFVHSCGDQSSERACGICTAACVGHHVYADVIGSDASDECSHPALAADIEGLVALRNAAPALLEVVAAAVALREQERVAAKTRHRVFSALNRNAVPSDGEYAATDVEDRKLKQLRDAYDAALAKVDP